MCEYIGRYVQYVLYVCMYVCMYVYRNRTLADVALITRLFRNLGTSQSVVRDDHFAEKSGYRIAIPMLYPRQACYAAKADLGWSCLGANIRRV